MIQIHKDDLLLFLGGLFLIFVVLFCIFGPQWLQPIVDAQEPEDCQCPYCTGQLGSVNAIVLDDHNSASFVNPNDGSVWHFEYVDGEGLIGSEITPEMEEDGGLACIYGGASGSMPTVDDEGNTEYVDWANDAEGNVIDLEPHDSDSSEVADTVGKSID